MAETKIPWCDVVLNPTTGCTPASEGCAHCYAAQMAKRFWGERKFSDVQCHPNRLELPYKWKEPKRVFVDSMGDLFHEKVPSEFIGKVLTTILRNQKHTFLLLTKRPERMKLWMKGKQDTVFSNNLWIGVSVENQKAADERIPLLLETPAAVKFISVEPMLGPVNIRPWIHSYTRMPHEGYPTPWCDAINRQQPFWVICGGESGPGARVLNPEWVIDLRDQCQATATPFYFKQWGAREPIASIDRTSPYADAEYNVKALKLVGERRVWWMGKAQKQHEIPYLEGYTWQEVPNVNN